MKPLQPNIGTQKTFNSNIFDSDQQENHLKQIIENDQFKNNQNGDSISIYLQQSARCQSEDSETSFIVQQIQQSQRLSTNQFESNLFIEQCSSSQDEDVYRKNIKAKLISKRHDKLQKYTEKLIKKQVTKSQKIKIQHGDNMSILKQKSQRKIRTSIDQQKFQQMQILFEINEKEKLQGSEARTTLKEIGQILNLGYSTVLHKYRQFKQTGSAKKGVLLQCKHFKRKYKKSEQIQNKIIEALKVKVFNTAIELAEFIHKNYGIKVSRSIVSRHLNLMKQQKKNPINRRLQFNASDLSKADNIENVEQSQNKLMSLNELKYFHKFKKLLLTFKNQNKPMYFFENFSVVLMNKTLFFQANLDELLRAYEDFQVLMISFTSDGNKIVDSNFETVSSQEASNCSQLLNHFVYVYVQQRFPQMLKMQTFERKLFLVYNFRAQQSQKLQRQKLYILAENNEVDLMFMPPQTQEMNFLRKWFYEKVFSEINLEKFDSSQDLKTKIQNICALKLNDLKHYSTQMFSKM